MSELMNLSGNDGQIELFADKIVIKRKGIFSIISHGFKGDKSIPIKAISTIELKEAGVLTGGEIKVIYNNGADSELIKFQKKFNSNFIDLKNKIFELINK